jgi:beta-galactosidase
MYVHATWRTALITMFVVVAAIPLMAAEQTPTHTFQIGAQDFLLDGKRFQIRCGELHAARIPREYWRHRLKMARAMGLNTVCAYLFWNVHEPRPGEFVWSGQADTAEFCRIAQEEGLWVLLRPGPYACAEWEMGGFPWWLLKHADIQLRTRDPRYLDAAKRYLRELGRVFAPLQVTRGGPILMVQVENEYGFFGKDAQYMGEIRGAMIDAGFDVPLFACNPADHLKDGYREDLFPVVNFSTDPATAFTRLREVLPTGPLMCGEFYPGWFDTWGSPHHRGNTERYLADLQYMLEHNASFSIYMAHGGTTFGLFSGADRPFKPDASSYDYDAPISEAGWTTDKFFKTRELMRRHLLPGEQLPEAPEPNPVITFTPVESKEFAPLLGNLPAPIEDATPKTMEMYDQGYGCILYRTKLPPGDAATFSAAAVHDFGFVFLEGKRIPGVLDRRSRRFKLQLPRRGQEQTLDVLAYPMGRVNFGAEVRDRKGLIAPIKLGDAELSGWQVFKLPLDAKQLSGLRYGGAAESTPGFWRFTVDLEKTGDTFFDLSPFGKGIAWVNGRCLGRFWNIGPTQTMYVPGPWLVKGHNEIVILDLLASGERPRLGCLDKPILDQLRPELDFANTRRPATQFALDALPPIHQGEFAPGSERQEIHFGAPAKGRYFALEALSSHDNKPFAAIAELDLFNAAGQPIARDTWTIAQVDSEERDREDGSAENAIDGQTATFWHTQWSIAQPGFPHRLVIDLGKTQTIAGFAYVPRQGNNLPGRIKGFRIFVVDAPR